MRSRRRAIPAPYLSMLDLLFGTFGAMIVIAALLTFLGQQEARIDQRPFYYVAAQVSSSPLVDLSRLYIEFEARTEHDRADLTVWSPRTAPSGQFNDHSTYHGRAAKDAASASLLITEDAFRNVEEAVFLAARLQNVPSLRFDDQRASWNELKDLDIEVSLVLKTAYNACAVTVTCKVGQLFRIDAEGTAPPELFELATRNPGVHDCRARTNPAVGASESKPNRIICDRAAAAAKTAVVTPSSPLPDRPRKGANFEVQNGRLEIYAP